MTRAVADRQHAVAAPFSPWPSMALHDVLDRAITRWPERPFVITDERTWTYAEVGAWSGRIAAGLQRRGIQAGERVALIMANYPEFVAIKYALSRIGAVAVPLNIFNQKAEIQYLLDQSECRALVTMDAFRGLDYLDMLRTIAPGWPQTGRITPALEQVFVFPAEGSGVPGGLVPFAELEAGLEPVAIFPKVDPGDLCDIIYTSGTSGRPKGVELTHDMLTRTAFGSAYARAFEDGHRMLFSLPMFHVFGYVEGLLAVPYVGGAIVPRLRFDADDTLDAIQRHRAEDMLSIPTTSLALIDAQKARPRDLASLRAILASGGRAPTRIWQEIRDAFGVEEITTGYGMTETTASTTVTRPDDPAERVAGTNGRMRDVGPAGNPALGGRLVDYQVADLETAITLPPNCVGELLARGPGVTNGYFRKPAETAAAFTDDGWFRTGDLGTIDEDGYITLIGRSKESYRCGGELVLPSEVEDLLTSDPAVLHAHVVPVPDERMGEIGVAFIIPREGEVADPVRLERLVRGNLARFKVPRHFLIVDPSEIPVTASGRPRKFLMTEIAQRKLELS
ncbi:MAG: class I adenylate-forming enzyme family protein [Pseudomonadota bacterium]